MVSVHRKSVSFPLKISQKCWSQYRFFCLFRVLNFVSEKKRRCSRRKDTGAHNKSSIKTRTMAQFYVQSHYRRGVAQRVPHVPATHFCQRLCRLQGHSAIGRISCQRKIPMTPAGIEPATFRFVEQHLNHCANAVSFTFIQLPKFSVDVVSRNSSVCEGPEKPNICCKSGLHFQQGKEIFSSLLQPY